MLATHAIKARVAASKWRLFGRRKLWLVHGTGETFVVTAKTAIPPKFGDEVLIVDVSDDRPILASSPRKRRLYVNFEKKKLSPEGSYAVWLGGSTITEAHVGSGEYECMSHMVQDWFTFVEDEVALTLLVVEHGGPLRMSNDLMTRL